IDNGQHQAHTLIIATGASANYLGLESETAFKNRGVSACAVCDGALPRFRGNAMAVVGGGDSAVEEATYLSKFASTVHLIVRRGELRASKIMAQRAFDNDKIKIHWHNQVEEVLGTDEDGVTGLRLRDSKQEKTWDLDISGLFLAIGHTPNVGFLDNQVQLKEGGYIQWTQPYRSTTSVTGVFAAGDVADDHYRQAITSAGSGCMAALDVERLLADEGML
ncbi:MAG: FAD-dependent oxidoreductase, partial [Planctomycetota bacterium]